MILTAEATRSSRIAMVDSTVRRHSTHYSDKDAMKSSVEGDKCMCFGDTERGGVESSGMDGLGKRVAGSMDAEA